MTAQSGDRAERDVSTEVELDPAGEQGGDQVGNESGNEVDAARLAAAVRQIQATWDAATLDGGPACSLPVAVRAYQRMQEAWFAELDAHAAVLDELAAAGPAAEA